MRLANLLSIMYLLISFVLLMGCKPPKSKTTSPIPVTNHENLKIIAASYSSTLNLNEGSSDLEIKNIIEWPVADSSDFRTDLDLKTIHSNLIKSASTYGVILARYNNKGNFVDIATQKELSSCYHIAKDDENDVYLLDQDFPISVFLPFSKVKNTIAFEGVLCLKNGTPGLFLSENESQIEFFSQDYLNYFTNDMQLNLAVHTVKVDVSSTPTKPRVDTGTPFMPHLSRQLSPGGGGPASPISASKVAMNSPTQVRTAPFIPVEYGGPAFRATSLVGDVSTNLPKNILNATALQGDFRHTHTLNVNDELVGKQNEFMALIQGELNKITPPINLKINNINDALVGLRKFEDSKKSLEQEYLPPTPANAKNRGGDVIKMNVEQNVIPKKSIIEKITNSEFFIGKEDVLVQDFLQAYAGSGSKVRSYVTQAIDDLYHRASDSVKVKIKEIMSNNLSHPNIKTRYFALEKLKEYDLDLVPSPGSLSKTMNVYDVKEISDWEDSFTKPELFQDNQDFMFMIHGVVNTPVRPKGEEFGLFKGKNAFEAPQVFLGRGRIATTIIGRQSGKEEFRTFAPTGFILSAPRQNITHASPQNFASTGKYVSRKSSLLSPKEILSTTEGKYNEILIEGKNRVSGAQSTIAGIYIKQDTPEAWAKEARDFAKSNSLPIVIIPGSWTYHFKEKPVDWDAEFDVHINP